MDPQTTWLKPQHVMLREVGGEAVLLDLETEKYFGLDEIGTLVLREIDRGATLDETVARVLAEYDATEATVRVDIESLVRSLVERGLLQTVDNG